MERPLITFEPSIERIVTPTPINPNINSYNENDGSNC